MFGIRTRRAGAALALVAAAVPIAACYDQVTPTGPAAPPDSGLRATIELAESGGSGGATTVRQVVLPAVVRRSADRQATASLAGDGADTLVLRAVVSGRPSAGAFVVPGDDGTAVAVRTEGGAAGAPPTAVTFEQGDRTIRVDRRWTPTDDGWVPHYQRIRLFEDGREVRTITVSTTGLVAGHPPARDADLTPDGTLHDQAFAAEGCFSLALRLFLDTGVVMVACGPASAVASPLACWGAVLNLLDDLEEYEERCAKKKD